MCAYCDYELSTCEYFQDGLTGDWYHSIKTYDWDEYDDDWVYIKNFGVKYCEYCGRELK